MKCVCRFKRLAHVAGIYSWRVQLRHTHVSIEATRLYSALNEALYGAGAFGRQRT